MAIRIEHGRPETLLTAAQIAGQVRAAKQQAEIDAKLKAAQMEIDYRTNLKQQDMALDLEMQQRSRMWEVEKMQLRSQIDFQREEQLRQRKLDSYDNIDSQLDKEVQAGRMTEKEAEPYKLKNDLARQGMNVSISDITRQREDDEGRFGVDPYWMRGRDAPEGTPERQLYEAKMQEGISGERRGVVPYYLDPKFIGNYPEAARQAQEARGIFLSDEEFDSLREGVEGGLPLADKELDVGVRASGLPVVTSDAEYDALPSGVEFTDQSGRRWRKP